MRKLISNNANKKIRRKHNDSEIKKGIITLDKVSSKEVKILLKQKLLEEVNEVLFAKTKKEFHEELDDVILICRELKGEISKHSEGWILKNTKGRLKNKEK